MRIQHRQIQLRIIYTHRLKYTRRRSSVTAPLTLARPCRLTSCANNPPSHSRLVLHALDRCSTTALNALKLLKLVDFFLTHLFIGVRVHIAI